MSIRRTTQRQAIRHVLEQEARPLSPAEIRELAAAGAPSLGIATVYRNLARLHEEGLVRAIDVPGVSGARWELTGKAHHHHFHCRLCDGVFEVADCPGSLVDIAPPGFRVEAHEIVLYGRCASCLAAR